MNPGATRSRERAYVALGSNLGDSEGHVRRALIALEGLSRTRVAARSALYLNPPMGPAGQPDYVNAVAAVDTDLDPRALLHALQAIERAHGRTRGAERWGPRTLDLDLLLYGDRRIAEEGLLVPHPGIAERVFVLEPLCDIAPDLEVPGLGRAARLLDRLERPERMRRLPEADGRDGRR